MPIVTDTPSNSLIGTDKYDPMMTFFQTNPPPAWKNNPQAMAKFQELYGPQAAGMVQKWGVWEGAQDPNFRPTAEQKARFGAEGQFYNTAPEMLGQVPADRSA